MEQNRVRIADIAEALGISTATVSNVIHGKTSKISDATVKRVEQELEKTGYIPNMAGILLARNNSRIIGVVMNDHVKYEGRVLEDGFVMSSLNALSREANEKGYFLMIKTTADIREIPVFASMWNMDGLILMGFCEADYEALRSQTRISFVVYDGYFAACSKVVNLTIGHYDGGYQAGQYARELGILKEKDSNFTGADVRNGMTAVIAVKHPEPRFEGQTKTKLDNPDAGKATADVTAEELVLFFDKHLEILKQVIACAEKSAKIRKAEEKAKTNMLTKPRFSIDSNGKLANCESRNPAECEVFIVEGDSAGGSAKMGRNRRTQAIMPIRGKILNVEKATMDKVLANAEIKTMINAFGCGFSEGYGNDFDITKLRYHKIIIMTDADVDGAHIDTLLLTFFYRFMPELINEGHVYLATPPLYKVIPKKGKEEYIYDDKALASYRKSHSGSFTLQRYKGLGEMDAEQLWETTLNPETRILKQVEIEDGRMASEITEMLMGSDVAPRRQFICEHAKDAQLDV